MMLLRPVDQRIGLTRAAAAVLSDPSDPGHIGHSLLNPYGLGRTL